jgi:multisubunit Na+/H+ antiporter MnhB subunit
VVILLIFIYGAKMKEKSIKRRVIELCIGAVLGVIVTIVGFCFNPNSCIAWIGGCGFGFGMTSQLYCLFEALEKKEKMNATEKRA